MALFFTRPGNQNQEVIRNVGVVSGPPFTFAGWFYTSQVGMSRKLFYLRQEIGGDNEWWVEIRSTAAMRMAARTTTTNFLTMSTVEFEHEWSHITAVWAADDDRRFYSNGRVKVTSSDLRVISGFAITKISVGWEGAITRPAMWNVALTDDEVLQGWRARGFRELPRRDAMISYLPLDRRDYVDQVSGAEWTEVNGPIQVMDDPAFLRERRWDWRSRIFVPAGGGQQFNQAVFGSVAAAGGLTRRAMVAYSGLSVPSGAVLKRGSVTHSGSVTPAGSLRRGPRTTLAGASSPSGQLLRFPQIRTAGTASSSGALVRQVRQVIAAAVAPAGNLIRRPLVALQGTISSSGTLSSIKTRLLALAGTVAAAGALVKRPILALAGAVTPAASLTRETRIRLTGTVTSSGALEAIRTVLLALAGTVTAAGALTRSALVRFAGAAAPVGALTKRAAVSLTGSVSSAGLLQKLATVRLAGIVAIAGAVAAVIAVTVGWIHAAVSLLPALFGRSTIGPALGGDPEVHPSLSGGPEIQPK